jgi:cell division protein FtsQ
MTDKAKHVLKLITYTLGAICAIALVVYGYTKQLNMPMKEFVINIDRSEDLNFVDEDDIKELLLNKGYKVIGDSYKTISVSDIEHAIDNDPSVMKSQAYKAINGTLTVDVKQRTPLVRIMNTRNDSYYIDQLGKLMPLSDMHSQRVLVCNGNVFESFGTFYHYDFSKTEAQDSILKHTKLDDIYAIAKYINNDEFLKAQIEQLYVDKDFILIPKLGNQTILLGDATNIPAKLAKLKAFYVTTFNKIDINKYSSINLKYANQIVCTKAVQ